jgi:hypothetical protein
MPTFIVQLVVISLLGFISLYTPELVAYGIIGYMLLGHVFLVMVGFIMAGKQWKEIRDEKRKSLYW